MKLTESQLLLKKIEEMTADLQLLRSQSRARLVETAHRDFTVALVEELRALITERSMPSGLTHEHLRIIPDFPNQRIECQIEWGLSKRSLMLSWATGKYVGALCDRRPVGAVETRIENGRLKIVSVNTRDSFFKQCIRSLTYNEIKEAA